MQQYLTPDWIEAFVIGAIMVGIYFWPRFDEPTSDTQSGCYASYSSEYLTSPRVYMRAKSTYLLMILSAYIVFSLVPQLLFDLIGASASKPPQLGTPNQQSAASAGLSSPLAVALAIIMLQQFPVLKDLERHVRHFVYRLAKIPEAIRLTANQMQSSTIQCRQTTIELITRRISPTLGGITVTKDLISKDEPLLSWDALGCLLSSIEERNRESAGLDGRFFDDNHAEYDAILAQYEAGTDPMRQRLASLLNNAPLPAVGEDDALMRQIRSLRQRLYTFIACAAHYSAKSATERSDILARLGFDAIRSEAIPNATLGPIIGLSFISVMIVSIVPVFCTQYFRASFLSGLGDPWSSAFSVPSDILGTYLWSWTTAFFYGAAIAGALAVRDARIRNRAWFNINELMRQRPVANYVTPVIVGTSAGCLTLIGIALIGGPGFHFGPNVLQEFGTALRDAVRNTLPWYPLAFVMAFLALWLVDSNVSVPQSRWNVVLAKVAATGLAGGIVMGFAGCLTSYISLSNSVSDFARSNNLEITGRITDAVIYVSIFIAALIAFFSTVLYLIVQLSTVYLDGTHSLAGKSLKDLNQKFLVWLDPAGEAGFYEPADTRLDPANQRSTGRWVQFPEGTVVRWSDTVCIGDTYTGRAGIISASDGIRYEGFNGRISGRAPFVANLEVAEHFAQPAAARVT